MVSPVTRIPPPPLLDLSIPSVPLTADPDRTPTLEINGILDMVNTDTHAAAPTYHTCSNSATAANSSALQRLIDLLHRIDVEMKGDIARVKSAIGEAEDDIKQLRAERTHRMGKLCRRASDESAKSVHEDDARRTEPQMY